MVLTPSGYVLALHLLCGTELLSSPNTWAARICRNDMWMNGFLYGPDASLGAGGHMWPVGMNVNYVTTVTPQGSISEDILQIYIH